MSNRNYNKKRRGIVLLVLGVVLILFLSLGNDSPLNNITKTGESVSNIVKSINDKISSLLGGTGKKEILTTGIENSKVQVHMLDIDQGDCFLVRTPDKDILIDGGEAAFYPTIEQYLKNLGIEKLDFLVATHPHSDHVGSLSQVIDNFQVGQILLPDIPDELIPTSRSFTNLLESIEAKNVSLFTAEPGTKYDLGQGIEFTVLGPVGQQKDLNNLSIITRLDCDDVSFLFTGDIEKDGEIAIIEDKGNIKVDVLAVAHHGSDTSTTQEFLKKSLPTVALISCGLDNGYGHPHKDVIERLKGMNIDIYRTDINGTVVVETDGKDIGIVCENERGETTD